MHHLEHRYRRFIGLLIAKGLVVKWLRRARGGIFTGKMCPQLARMDFNGLGEQSQCRSGSGNDGSNATRFLPGNGHDEERLEDGVIRSSPVFSKFACCKLERLENRYLY
jgi:hypothetical protein